MPFSRDRGFLDDAAGFLDLLQRRHQRGAVLQRPAVILHIGDFQPVGIEIDRHLDDVGQLMQVLPVHHRVDGQRQIEFAGPARDFELLLVGILQPGDAVGDDGLIALKADLHMAQPGIGQRLEFFLGQQHGRGDEVGVQPDVAGVLHQFDQILARGRLAAGEMNLQHADLGELGQNLFPFLGGEFGAAALQFDRIGAIRALQRTAMRQFGQHRERNAKGFRRRAALLP